MPQRDTIQIVTDTPHVPWELMRPSRRGKGEREMRGFETLTLAPIDRTLIEPGLLRPEEIAWLDSYHARVREELSPLVDEATRRWLEEATRPVAASTG